MITPEPSASATQSAIDDLVARSVSRLPAYIPALAVYLSLANDRSDLFERVQGEHPALAVAHLDELLREEHLARWRYGFGIELGHFIHEEQEWSFDHPEEMPGELLLDVVYGRILEMLGRADGRSGTPILVANEDSAPISEASDWRGGFDTAAKRRIRERRAPGYWMGYEEGKALRALGGGASPQVNQLLMDFQSATRRRELGAEEISGLVASGDLIRLVLPAPRKVNEATATVLFSWAMSKLRRRVVQEARRELGPCPALSGVADHLRIVHHRYTRGPHSSESALLLSFLRTEAALLLALENGLGLRGVGRVVESASPGHELFPQGLDLELSELDLRLAEIATQAGLIRNGQRVAAREPTPDDLRAYLRDLEAGPPRRGWAAYQEAAELLVQQGVEKKGVTEAATWRFGWKEGERLWATLPRGPALSRELPAGLMITMMENPGESPFARPFLSSLAYAYADHGAGESLIHADARGVRAEQKLALEGPYQHLGYLLNRLRLGTSDLRSDYPSLILNRDMWLLLGALACRANRIAEDLLAPHLCLTPLIEPAEAAEAVQKALALVRGGLATGSLKNSPYRTHLDRALLGAGVECLAEYLSSYHEVNS